jgi:hypothetical protein
MAEQASCKCLLRKETDTVFRRSSTTCSSWKVDLYKKYTQQKNPVCSSLESSNTTITNTTIFNANMRTETPIHGDELLEHVSLDGGVNGSGELQKGTNDKRVLSSGTESDLESRKEQLSFDDCSKQQALSGPGQPFSVSTLERLLSRGKTLPPQGLHARSGEHEVYAMFGRSPGLPGKHLREEVISLEDVAEVSGIPLPDSKRPENEEPTDSYVRLFSGVGKAVVWQSTYTNPRLGPQSLTSLNAGK